MLKLGEWHIEPSTPDGVPARCALIIEPVETVYPVDEKLTTVDYYRAVDFMAYGGARLTDRYGIPREPAAPASDAEFKAGDRVQRRHGYGFGTVEDVTATGEVIVRWDMDTRSTVAHVPATIFKVKAPE